MLRATVTLSRKISRDYNSTGYGITLDGEIPHPADDVEAVLEKVGELFHLAEEALAVEIERQEGDQPRARREGGPSLPPSQNHFANSTKTSGRTPTPETTRLPSGNGQGASNGTSSGPESATPKQLQYLQNLGKRKGFARDALDGVITRVIGSQKDRSDLTKREAGQVIDHLTKLEPENAR